VSFWNHVARNPEQARIKLRRIETACSGGIDDGFVDQQNGNVVPNGIDPLAGAALQALAFPLQREGLFTGGADQDVEQVFGIHRVYLIRYGNLILVFPSSKDSLHAIDFHTTGRVNSHHVVFVLSQPTWFAHPRQH
jgi:hypothetical protein